jgi:CRP/FNR family transcriptional regulator, cyclic AMP receptor protein
MRRGSGSTSNNPVARSTNSTAGTTVRVLDQDLELAATVDQAVFQRARQAAVAPLVELSKGPWQPPASPRQRGRDFGLLILSGLLVRDLELAGRSFAELRGPEDLLRPWDDAAEVASVRARITWTAHQPTRLAWLDGEFASAIAPWPQIASALIARATRRARLLSFRLAITELKHVDLRVLLLLWHLADRWGKVTAEGVHLDLELTHDLIARMIGAHRTSVTLALHKLSDEGRIARKGRRLTLLGTPPENLNDTLTALAAERP